MYHSPLFLSDQHFSKEWGQGAITTLCLSVKLFASCYGIVTLLLTFWDKTHYQSPKVSYTSMGCSSTLLFFFSSCEELFPIAAVPLVYFYFSCLCFGAFGVMYKAMLPQSTSHSLPSVFFWDFYGVIFYVYGSHSFDVVSIYSARYLWCLILCFN